MQKRKSTSAATRIESVRHKDKRKNIPTEELRDFVVEQEQKPIRAGHVISRPASSGIAHTLRAGAAGITYLSYGTRNPNDVCYYPRSNKIYFRGLGLIARLEDLDYDDGEPG